MNSFVFVIHTTDTALVSCIVIVPFFNSYTNEKVEYTVYLFALFCFMPRQMYILSDACVCVVFFRSCHVIVSVIVKIISL